MKKPSKGRKVFLLVILLLLVGVHVGLFAAGGRWRTLGKIMVAVDLFSGWFVIGAICETRKLEQNHSAEIAKREV